MGLFFKRKKEEKMGVPPPPPPEEGEERAAGIEEGMSGLPPLGGETHIKSDFPEIKPEQKEEMLEFPEMPREEPAIAAEEAEMPKEMEAAKDKVAQSVAIAVRLIKELRPLCQGVHIMPIGWDKKVPLVLDAAGL